jgi:hypothetical protein
MSQTAMIYPIYITVDLICGRVHGSLQITAHEYPLMHYKNLIREPHFTPGRPLVIRPPPVEEG